MVEKVVLGLRDLPFGTLGRILLEPWLLDGFLGRVRFNLVCGKYTQLASSEISTQSMQQRRTEGIRDSSCINIDSMSVTCYD
jgi:hypothetical protein